MPEHVQVAMAEIAGSVREGLLAPAVGAGMQVMAAMLEESVTALCGPRGRHDPERTAVRHGTEAGSVVLGGRKMPVRRPRVRTADGTAEVAVPAYETFASADLLEGMALEKMLGKLSTRRYGLGLEPVGTGTAKASKGTSKSAISRRFIAATEKALGELMTADLYGLELAALMIDGLHFARALLRGRAGHRRRRHQAPARPGRRVDRGCHPGPRAAGRPARTRPGGHLSGAGGAGRRQGAPPRRGRCVRPARHPALPAAQNPKCQSQAAREAAGPGRAAAAGRLPRRVGPGRRGQAGRAGHRTRQEASRRCGVAARGHGRDPDHPAPGRPADPGADTALDESDRVDDRDL